MNAALPGAFVLLLMLGVVWWLCDRLSEHSRVRQPKKCITLHCIASADVCKAFLSHEARPAWYRDLIGSRPLLIVQDSH
jgi:hypothetical protein